MNPSSTSNSIAVLTIKGGKEDGGSGKTEPFNNEVRGEERRERKEVEGKSNPIFARRWSCRRREVFSFPKKIAK